MFEKKFILTTLLVLITYFHISIQADPSTTTAPAVKNCYKCDTQKSECVTDPTKVDTVSCTTSCYTRISDKGIITRGCLGDTEECKDDGTCYNCTAAETPCNTNNVCKTCDSSKTATCAQTQASDVILNGLCSASDTKCFNKVNEKNIVRGCATTEIVNACTDEKTCKTCTGGICNVGIFPSDRRQCYQCSSTDTACAKPTDTELLACKLLEADEQCYTTGTNETAMARGCLSDKADVCPSTDKKECKFCKDKNGCNNIAYEVQQTLKCVQCNSTNSNTNCLNGAVDSTACEKKILYNAEEACFTQTKDGTTVRGCLHDRDTTLGDCTNENSCSTCSEGDGCNKESTLIKTCIRCRSDEDENCRKNAAQIAGTNCTKDPGDNIIQCYHGEWNNVVIRGCLVDADERMQVTCLESNNKQCDHCSGTNCNTKERSSASLFTINSSLIAAFLFILLTHLK